MQAASVLALNEINALICIGGDGSLTGLQVQLESISVISDEHHLRTIAHNLRFGKKPDFWVLLPKSGVIRFNPGVKIEGIVRYRTLCSSLV